MIMFGLYFIAMVKVLLSDNKSTLKKFELVFLMGFILIAPFIMCILLNSSMPFRALLSVHILVAFMWFVNIKYITNNRLYKGIIILVAFFAISNQVQTMNRLFYVEEYRYMRDVNFADTLMNDVIEVNQGYIDKPIYLVGNIYEGQYIDQFYSTNLYERNEVIGRSLFGYALAYEPNRLNFLMNVLGYNVNISNYTGEEKFEDIPTWPAKESIFIKDDAIYIKLNNVE